ncbi:MAG: hypothetical protein ACJA15_000348 [Flavobacteriales bacterium]|jgi:hypothetical protein
MARCDTERLRGIETKCRAHKYYFSALELKIYFHVIFKSDLRKHNFGYNPYPFGYAHQFEHCNSIKQRIKGDWNPI